MKMNKINLMINMWKQEADELDTILSNSYKHIERAAIAGNVIRLRQCISDVELLLKHDESKQPQPPDFANTMLGEVPPVGDCENSSPLKAVEGATPVVRQNEQTKEVYCNECGMPCYEQPIGNWRCRVCDG